MATNAAHRIPPFKGFSKIYSQLSAQLDIVKNTAGQGQTPAFSAYSKTHSKANDIIAGVVNNLSPTQVGYLSGIGFQHPGNTDQTDTKNCNQTDIINALLAAFDVPASKYVKGDASGGDSAKPQLKKTLSDYDTAVQTQGQTPAPKPS